MQVYIHIDSINLPQCKFNRDGADKTVFRQTANFPVFETINGEGIAAQTTSLNRLTYYTLKVIQL